METKKLQEIESIIDALARAFHLFEWQWLRPGTWGLMFKEHVEKHYPDPKKANSKRTNFPRAVFKKDKLTWETFMEALDILSPLYESIRVTVKLDDGERLTQFHFDVNESQWSVGPAPKKIPPINARGKGRGKTRTVDPAVLIMPKDQDRRHERGATFIIRELFHRRKITIGQLVEMIDAYLADERNRAQYTTSSLSNIRNSMLSMFLPGNVQFSNFYRLLAVLGYVQVSVRIEAKTGHDDKVTEVGNLL